VTTMLADLVLGGVSLILMTGSLRWHRFARPDQPWLLDDPPPAESVGLARPDVHGRRMGLESITAHSTAAAVNNTTAAAPSDATIIRP